MPGPEWLIPAGIILLLFGGRKLPELARAVGESLGEFRKATDESRAAREQDSAADDASDVGGTRPDGSA